ncbi:3507_t:CDS:2, partial [Ambispora leptoticha]
EIRNLKKKTNYQSEIDSIDKLADWLAGPEKDHKPKESDPVPTTFDEWADKHLWLEKEDPVRHIDRSITWFSRCISKLAPQKKLNNHEIDWKMGRMKRQMQFDNNNIPIDLKEEWVLEEKHEWKIESHE